MAKSNASMELLVPAVSDVIFKYTWHIKKYAKCNKKDLHDSPPFDFNVNGIHTRWNLSIRYWRGPEGKRLANPVVLCLNLLSSQVEEAEQVRVRFQFAVRNMELGQWEPCQVSRVALQLQNSKELLSVGYRDLNILNRHVDQPSGDVEMSVKLQVVQTDGSIRSLATDMGRLLDGGEGSDVTLAGDEGRPFSAHSSILSARSEVLAAMIRHQDDGSQLDIDGVGDDILQELLRYIYTDRVDNLDTLAGPLIAAADRFQLPGLKALCERALVETITPERVASLLLLADQYDCDTLKRAALTYCEDKASAMKKSMKWKVMEVINPDLFLEVREAGLGSSISSGLDSIPSNTDLLTL